VGRVPTRPATPRSNPRSSGARYDQGSFAIFELRNES
jgi:hypothetical protein